MIYLASSSPRRHELLCQAGIEHRVLRIPSPPGEDEPRLPGELPDAYVQRTAHEKALRALHWLGLDIEAALPDWRRPDHRLPLRQCTELDQTASNWPRSEQQLSVLPVLTADTTVILGDDILGKPRDAAHAAQMLQRLSGTEHHVHTAIVLAIPKGKHVNILGDVSRTQVRFKTLSEEEISSYCATEEPMGKAGAYGIQGRAAVFVEYLRGSYSGVVGLPLFETGRLLQQGIKK